ncbi:MAG: hypothetical protein HF314_16515 [Ignavibacteria bacterium]|jgi:hypothetical protein|nr:hypothetical protein [Ignavibacteria bacterium]MCU7504687.1 hypothetical protein [Ignavibacteria bacterium]MCU7516289.1 hypothetical protein [Ignavibacteria bacterium]
MIAPIVIIIISALFGLHILTNILQNKITPKVSVAIHGVLNAIALILVIIGAARLGSSLLTASMIVLIIAALGGFYLLSIDIGKKQIPPRNFAIVHPIIGVIGLILLIIYVAGM